MRGRCTDLQEWLWDERKMLRVGRQKEKARPIPGEGGGRGCGVMWASSQIELVALTMRLTLLCCMLGRTQEPLQFPLVFCRMTFLSWLCVTGKHQACHVCLIETPCNFCHQFLPLPHSFRRDAQAVCVYVCLCDDMCL